MKTIIINRLIQYELIKFIIIGIFNTVVSILLMYIFYNIIAIGYWGSSSVSYIVCSILSFLLNKKITFRNNDSLIETTPKFFFNILVCYAIAYLIAKPSMHYLMSFVNITAVQIVEQVALLFGVCLFTILNFIGQKYFVFKNVKV